jgi:malate dehydrogenase (oxaloacetate-decarboxylating)(NADP+)
VLKAYGVKQMKFGRDYIVPKQFDMRVLEWEAMAVAKAAMESGVAQEPVDLKAYKGQLKARLEHIKHLQAPNAAVKAKGARA